MPTYQYACTECDERLEVVQKFTDDPLTVCSACGGKLRKLFSAVGIVFKGSGFYRTDSRNGSNGSGGSAAKEKKSDGQSAATGAGSDSGNGSGSKADGGSSGGESKTAKKPDTAGSTSTGTSPSSGTKVA